MTGRATEELKKIKEPEVKPQESNTLKTAQMNSDTLPSDKEFNEPGTKELKFIPEILTKVIQIMGHVWSPSIPVRNWTPRITIQTLR